MADPPHGVRDEHESACLVEFLGGFDQSQVALVDEVGQAQALVLVLLSHGNDEAQVGFGELLQRFAVAFLDGLCKFDFFLDGDQVLAADLLEVFV